MEYSLVLLAVILTSAVEGERLHFDCRSKQLERGHRTLFTQIVNMCRRQNRPQANFLPTFHEYSKYFAAHFKMWL